MSAAYRMEKGEGLFAEAVRREVVKIILSVVAADDLAADLDPLVHSAALQDGQSSLDAFIAGADGILVHGSNHLARQDGLAAFHSAVEAGNNDILGQAGVIQSLPGTQSHLVVQSQNSVNVGILLDQVLHLRVRIFGENGAIEWRQETSEQVLVTTRDGIRTDLHRGDAGILPGAAKYGRLPSGHTEGWLESMANLYRSFCQCLNAKKEGIFVPEMIDYPTVDDGVEGVRFVEACLASSEAGGIWVDL